jgi:hypothetical protein
MLPAVTCCPAGATRTRTPCSPPAAKASSWTASTGLSYQEIAAKGGGILNSALRLRALPEDELFQAWPKRTPGPP